MSDHQEKKDYDTSKLERVLSTHSLEGLVFEKRERKQTVNPLPQFYNPQKPKLPKKPHKSKK